MEPKRAAIVQIATTYTGSLFALCSDGSLWERVRSSNNAIGEGQYRWEQVPHKFEVRTPGDDEVESWAR